jgi:Glycosyltransferase WbsX
MAPYEVAAYYFPHYHVDPLNERWHGPGWTEWQILQQAQPRFVGHRQPVTPAWGYFDEAALPWMARQIDLAADYGITTFLFDWYWYHGGPFLHRALEQGFLGAANRDRLKFALMWANHDWVNIFPMRYTNKPEILATGRITRVGFDRLTNYALDHYFTQPNYLHIDDAPYFSIYELGTFIRGMGGIIPAQEALAQFRHKAQARGFRDVHLNAIIWGMQVLPSEMQLVNPQDIVAQLGFASVGSYVWIHHFDLTQHGFPSVPYAQALEANERVWYDQQRRFLVPYFPNITMGWDSSPRTAQSDTFALRGYPWLAVLEGNTPHAFGEALRRAKAFLDERVGGPRLVTINAWNEWTEGSYLLPDTAHGNAYLEAIRTTFPAPLTNRR